MKVEGVINFVLLTLVNCTFRTCQPLPPSITYLKAICNQWENIQSELNQQTLLGIEDTSSLKNSHQVFEGSHFLSLQEASR